MRSSSPLIIFLLFIIPVTAFSQFTLPFFEDFDEFTCDTMVVSDSSCFSYTNPDGWTFPGNWRTGERGWTTGEVVHYTGNPPPAAYFYWTPQVSPGNPGAPDTIMIGGTAFYSFRMTTPTIAVGTAEQVQVSFDFELDFYQAGDIEGLFVEYRIPGQDWQIVLNPEVAPGVLVNYPLRNDSYIVDVTDSIQLGFQAYGINSININSWDIDNVTVTPLPQLTNVSISSNNSLDSTLAVTGDIITLLYTSDTPLISTSVIIANDTIPQGNITNISGNNWQATYVVEDTDEDGPVSFVTMFIGQFTAGAASVEVDGNPKTTTTDNSLVVIDRTGPGQFEVGAVNTFEALETDTIWYSNDDSLRMLVNIPPDTAIVKFLYSSGTSLSFDTNEFVTLNVSGSTIEPTDSITVEAWIKPTNTYENYDGFFFNADLPGDINQWKGYGWFYYGSGWHFFLRTENPDPVDLTGNEWPVAAVQTGEWSHLAATYDGTYIKTYRNGLLIEQKEASGNIQYPASDDVWIGKFVFNSNNGFFDGKIDEVRI